MKQRMEYVRWQMDNWRTRYHGGDWSNFPEIMKIAHCVWHLWKRAAFLMLVLAFLPILFFLVVFLSFIGFICAVPLLCGAATYYLIFRNFSLPLSIIECIYPSNAPSEGLIASSQFGEERVLHCVPFDIQEVEIKQDCTLLKTSAIGGGGIKELLRRPSVSKNTLRMKCELRGNESGEADNRECQNSHKLVCPSEGNHECGIGSISSFSCRSNAVLQIRGPLLLLRPAKLPGQYERCECKDRWRLYGTNDESCEEDCKREVSMGLSDEIFKLGQQEVPTSGPVVQGKGTNAVDSNLTHTYSSADTSMGLNSLVPGSMCNLERINISGADWSTNTGIFDASSVLDSRGEHSCAEPVFSEHAAGIPRNGETRERYCRYSTEAKDCRAVNKSLTGNSGVMARGPPSSNFQSHVNEVEDWAPRTLWLATMTNADVLDCTSFNERGTSSTLESPSELSLCTAECFEAEEKCTFFPVSHSALTTSEAAFEPVRPKHWRETVEDAELSSAFSNVASIENLQGIQDVEVSNCEQRKENIDDGVNGRFGPSLRFSSLYAYQRRLSFSNALSDDKLVSPGCCIPHCDFTPDFKQRSISTSFSDYPWSTDSSEQGLEILSNQDIACKESLVDMGSRAPYDRENSLKPGAASDSSFLPTPDQLSEDWEARRKRWEEESTPGTLAPLCPNMRSHSAEARSICNPLFEFSTPSPPPKKLKIQDTNDVSNPPSLPTRFCKQHSGHPDDPPTDAELSERVEHCSGEFEDLLGYWRRRESMAHSLIPSRRQSLSPAELAQRIRDEIDTVQVILGQKIPPQYSLWKEVEVLSQLVGVKLPYMGDISDICKAREGLDLLKVSVQSSYVVD